MTYTIQLRRDLAANWTTDNPVLAAGELGIELDTGLAKLGDGTTTWTSKNYWSMGQLQPSGDGSGATDVANINRLLAAGQPVYLVPGATYTINAPIVIKNQSFLTGFQWNMSSQNDYYSAGSGNPAGAVIQTLSNFTGFAAIYLPDPGTGVQHYGVDISGISVVSFSSSVSMHSMAVIGAWGACFLRGVQLQKGSNDCLHFDVGGSGAIPDDWQITDCKFSAARTGYGVNIANNLADSWFDNCESSECALDGWYSGWLDNTRFSNCKGENNGRHGWNLNSGSTDPAMLSNCNSQLNGQNGFLFGGSANYILTGCRSYYNSQSGRGGPYAGFKASGATGLIMGTGCWAVGDTYGAWLGGSSNAMAFTGSYLYGNAAPTFDDGSNTETLLHNLPAFGGETEIIRDQVSNLYTSAGATTGTITFATNPAIGSTVIVALANTGSPPTLVDNGTTPSTFTVDERNQVETNNIFIMRANNVTMPASGAYQLSFTVGAGTFAALAISYLSVTPGAPAGKDTTQSTSGTAVSTGPVTGNGLMFAAFSDNDTATHTVTLTNGSFTEQGTSTGGGTDPGGFGVADWLDTGVSSAVTCTWTLGTASQWEAAIANYLPITVPTLSGRVTTSGGNVLDDSTGNATFGSVTSNRVIAFGVAELFGGISSNLNVQTANYAIVGSDSTVIMNGTGLTATLPSAAAAYFQTYHVRNINSSPLILATTSSQTIDGVTGITLPQYASVTVQSDGSNWRALRSLGDGWLNVIAFGADPTGTNDSTTAINAAITASGTIGTPVYLPPGTYKITGTLNLANGQSLCGDGSQATSLNYTGSGIAIKVDINNTFTGAQYAGRLTGFYLSGYSGGGSAVGIQYGDLQGILIDDVEVAGFGGAGLHFLNASGDWAEQSNVRVRIVGCGTAGSNTSGAVVLDNSSFDYTNFDFLIVSNAGAHGLLMINNAQIQGGELRMRGNFIGSVGNTAAVIAIDPANTAASPHDTYIRNTHCNVACETTGSGTGHYLLYMGSTSAASQFFATGVLNLSSVGPASQGISNAHFLPFEFSGIIGDQSQGVIASYGYEYIISTDTSGTSGGALAVQPYNKLMTFQGQSTAYNSVNVFNVVSYGADPTGTNDSATAIQAAITAAGSGGAVYFPAGTYLVGTTIQVPGNITLLGDGQDISTIKMKNATNLAAVAASSGWTASTNGSSVYPVLVRGLTFDGNNTNQTSGAGHGLVLQSFYSTVEDCTFQSTRGDGLRWDTTGANGTTQISNSMVENSIINCRFRNNGGMGFNASDTSFNKLTDGWISECIVENPGTTGIHLGAGAGWKITDNHVYGPAPQSAIAVDRAYFTRVTGNYIEGWGTTTTSGLYCGIDFFNGGVNDSGSGSIIANNVMYVVTLGNVASYSCGIGVFAVNNQQAHVTITGNTIVGLGSTPPTNQYYGILLQGQNSAATVWAVMSGNLFDYNWSGGNITTSGTSATVYMSGDNTLGFDGTTNVNLAIPGGLAVKEGVALVESAGAPWVTAAPSASTVTSASFTPTANSLVVAIGIAANGGNGGESAAVITDSLSGTWKTLAIGTVSASSTAIIAVQDAGASPAARTVTMTATGANGSVGLIVRQFSGARPAAEQIGATTVVQTIAQPFTASVTPDVSGSQVVGAYGTSSVAVTLTANSATSIYGQVNDNTHGDTSSAFEASALSVGGVAETLGFTNTGTHAVAMLLAEILPAYPLAVYANNTVVTKKNTLDDSLGNATFAGGISSRGTYNVLTYGADPTGSVDSTTAIQTAVTAAINAGGGVVYLPAGTYKTSSTITATLPNNVTAMIAGDGYQATVISYHGTGDCLRMYDSTAWTTGNNLAWRSGLRDLTIDGTNATGNSTGLHIGDVGLLKLDIRVTNFTTGTAPSYTGTGSIGINFDNTVTWMEEADVRATVANCTQHVIFQATTGYGSFGYGNFDFTIFQGNNQQDGVVLLNGGNIYHGSLRVRGNFLAGASTTSAAVVRVAGLNSSGGPTNGDGSVLSLSHVDFQVECASGTHAPMTLYMDSHGLISGLYGIMSFSWGAGSFASSSIAGTFTFQGYIDGDTTLGITGYNTNGNQKVTGTLVTAHSTMDDGSGNVTINGNGQPVLAASTSAAAAFTNVINFLAPNLTTGQQVYYAYGQALSTNNSFTPGFNYNGPGSAANAATFGFYGGSNALAITAANEVETLHNVLDDGSANAVFAGNTKLAVGTASLAPLTFQSGTNLTTPAAGAMEFDGTAFYATAQASARQVVDAEQFITLTSAYTLTSQTAAQKLFNASTNGALTVEATTAYYFECFFTLSAMSSTSGSFGFALGGTATLTSQMWETEANKATLATAASAQNTVNTAANTSITSLSTATVGWAKIWGKIRVNAAGTIIPQVSLTQAAAAIVGADSYFRIWAIGASTVTKVGNWS